MPITRQKIVEILTDEFPNQHPEFIAELTERVLSILDTENDGFTPSDGVDDDDGDDDDDDDDDDSDDDSRWSFEDDDDFYDDD